MIQIVKGLNKPYRRIDFMIGGICQIIDGITDIISLGYIRTDFNSWWTLKCLRKFCDYIETNGFKK